MSSRVFCISVHSSWLTYKPNQDPKWTDISVCEPFKISAPAFCSPWKWQRADWESLNGLEPFKPNSWPVDSAIQLLYLNGSSFAPHHFEAGLKAKLGCAVCSLPPQLIFGLASCVESCTRSQPKAKLAASSLLPTASADPWSGFSCSCI